MQTYANSAVCRIPVSSSSVATVAYSASAYTLEVEFRRGPVYRYFGVPYVVFLAFLAAPSKGRFFNANVRPYFAHQRV